MKKASLLALAVSCFLMVSCGGDEKKDDKKKGDKKEEVKEEETNLDEEEVAIVEVAMTDMDLSEHGYNLTISLPEGVLFFKGKWDDALKNKDQSFALVVQNIEITKEENLNNAKENTINKFQSILDENEHGYLIQTEVMGKDDFHIFYTLGEGDDQIVFENEKGILQTKENSLAMFESLKSIQVK